MSYAVSQLDRDNFQWFANDKSRNSLVGIKVDNGSIRGIIRARLTFRILFLRLLEKMDLGNLRF